MWSLRVLSGPQAGQIFDLKFGKNILGRGGSSDYKVVSLGISKEHCEVHVYKDKMMIVDLKSSNGTFVNGVKIQNSLIRLGDKISLFDVILDVIPTPEIRPKKTQAVQRSVAPSSSPVVYQKYESSGSSAPQLYSQPPAAFPQMHVDPQAMASYNPGATVLPQQGTLPHVPLSSTPGTSAPTPKLTFADRFDQYMEKVVMPVIYRLAILFSFKQVLMSFVVIYIFMVTLLSMIPLSRIMQESNLIEASKRARSVARALAKFNEQALLSGQLGQLSVQEALKEEGIKEALIVQQSDGLIVAPSEKAGRDMSRSFVLQARKEGRAMYARIDGDTIGATHPIGVYDPSSGEPTVKYHAIVFYDVSSLNIDQERLISLFMQTLIIASLFGLLLYYLFTRLIEYPIRSLNTQIDQALIDKSDRTEVLYDYPAFQKLVANVNTLLNRVWTVQSSSGLGLATQQNKDIEYSHLVEMIPSPACVVDASDQRVVALNQNFSELIQSPKEDWINQSYQSLPDSALVQNMDSLIARSRQSPYDKHEDRIPFSQFECQIYCQAFLNTGGEVEHFILTLVKVE